MKLYCRPVGFLVFRNFGFSLVEVVLALGLVSFCLVAMLGMLPIGLSQERKSADQMQSLHALTAIASDFKNAPAGSSESPVYGLPIPSVGATSPDRATISLDENFCSTQKGGGPQAYEVSYRVEAPISSFSSHRLSLRISKSTRVGAATDPLVDAVETVILKPLPLR